MLWSPNVLTAIRSGTLYEAIEQSRQAQRTTPIRGVGWTATTPGTQPDYGCVDWFVYEEERQRPEPEGA